MNHDIQKQDTLETELIRLRRMFHQHPETGFTEFCTTARICEYLHPLNCRLIMAGLLKESLPKPHLLASRLNTPAFETALKANPQDSWMAELDGIPGAVAVFKGKNKGPRIGLRFDIDGLPIRENSLESHLPFHLGFSSGNQNMHACGHDGHIAMGLGLASLISRHLDELKGEFYLIFQPAEEVIQGGKIFSGLKFVKELDSFFAIHLGMSGPGKITCGVNFFADKRFRVAFKGKSAHAGGSPHLGKNALLAACSAITGLYGISRHASGDSRINIGAFSSPNAVNVIPDRVEFELDLRSQTNQVMDYLTCQAENMIRGAALMQEVEYEIDFVTEAETASNSREMIAAVKKACLDIGMKNEDIIDRLEVSGSEDATFIMNEVLKHGGKTAFIGIGAPVAGMHHNDNFDFDEADLLRGVNLLFQLVLNLSGS